MLDRVKSSDVQEVALSLEGIGWRLSNVPITSLHSSESRVLDRSSMKLTEKEGELE